MRWARSAIIFGGVTRFELDSGPDFVTKFWTLTSNEGNLFTRGDGVRGMVLADVDDEAHEQCNK